MRRPAGSLPADSEGGTVFARPSLRSRLASSGAKHPSDDSGGRSGARHAEEPRELRRKRPFSRCRPRIGVPQASLAESREERSHPAGSGNISTRAHGGTEGSPSSAWCRLPYGVAPGPDTRYWSPQGRLRAEASSTRAIPRSRPRCPSCPPRSPSMARRGPGVHPQEV